MKIALTLGTRPEIIKLYRLALALRKDKRAKTEIIHSGQHYSYLMNEKFIEELHLPEISKNLEVGSGSHASQVGTMLVKFESEFLEKGYDFVVAEGDTNSTLASCLAAEKIGIQFGHVEAGIRSFDREMPEEINRVLTDQVSSFLFAPTRTAVSNLKKSEAIKKGIFLTGNPIVEATRENLEKAKKSRILGKLGLEENAYCTLTLHREENTKSREKMKALLNAAGKIGRKIIYPIHPRSEKTLKEYGLWEKAQSIPNLELIEPLGYLDFLSLCKNSKYILTDSGGIQEEASIYNKPVIILRENTERPEILGKWGWLAGVNEKRILQRAKWVEKNHASIVAKAKKLQTPFGDGKASERIAKIILESGNRR
ncbi:MAG: UDP-N-acetylglucosamine 2-epimerase (non-hydrolyzing) [Candidatus Diapherotrites archaeon]|nr:UDP-N-acetylglucosamine 2-epimerase (non-hydrolyzing) [Candidatus Diapherotrites archaeon]